MESIDGFQFQMTFTSSVKLTEPRALLSACHGRCHQRSESRTAEWQASVSRQRDTLGFESLW